MVSNANFALRALSLAILLNMAAAHGTCNSITLGGKHYSAPEAAEGKPFILSETPVRQLGQLEPISDFSSQDTVCGRGAAASAKLVAPVTAGSDFSFGMQSGTGGLWPHERGAVLFYLGKCPGSAADCDAASLKWFKVDQLGLKPSGNNLWWQEELARGRTLTGTIPKGIANGDYLLRFEILALHNAMSVGGAETTVACAQIRVSGGGGGTPSASQLVKFPGAYSPTDPGILIDIWNSFKTYDFPGPALFGSGSSGNAPSTSRPTAGSPKPTASGTKPPVNVAPLPTKAPTSTVPAPLPSSTKVCRRRRSPRAIIIEGHSYGRRALHGGRLRHSMH